ncbi:MAG TPA: hypothetical protein VKX39_05900 [Bryobacteraceae bacterium]|jgi:hypothetical protein|nr:hypothetical protein [Bryobacteraceae bacterium]
MFKTEFTGLDGGNLLAYLAALGTLRVLTFADPQTDVRLEWVDRGAWTPVLHHPAAGSAEEILKLLEPLVCGEGTIDPGWEIGNDLTLPCEEFGKVLGDAVKNGGVWKRSTLDFLAAFGAEVYGTGPKKDLMSDTAFRTMSGAGDQHFLGS